MQLTPCDYCAATDYEPIWHRGHPSVDLPTVVCRACGLLQTNPRPSPKELENFYATQYRLLYSGARVPGAPDRANMTRQALDRFTDLSPRLRPAAKILELGCATGEFLRTLAQAGHACTGVELSPDCAAEARKSCPDVRLGAIENQSFPDASFDAICLFHVIEHLDSPSKSLAKLASWLRPDGLLYLEVPDADQPYHGNLSRFFQIAHLYSFTQRTLAAFLLGAGLEPIWSRRLVEGKFLRIIAAKRPQATPAEARPMPIEPWQQVRGRLLAWRRRWNLCFKWKSLLDRHSSAVLRRLGIRSPPNRAPESDC